MTQVIKDIVSWLKQWFYTESEVDTLLNGKQATLVSGTNIKTINNTSLLGSGNISVGGGGSSVEIVTSWNNTTSDSKVPSETLVKSDLDKMCREVFLDFYTNIGYELFNTDSMYSNLDFCLFSKLFWNADDDALYYLKNGDSTDEIATMYDIPDVSGKENTSNKVSSWSATTNNTRYPSEKLVKDSLDNKVDETDLLDLLYPIGAIYIDANTTSFFCPIASTLGGTWVRIQDAFLLASSDAQGVGSTGGSADAIVVEHTHIQNAHTHTQDSHNHTQNAHNHEPATNTNSFLTATINSVGRRQVGSSGTNRGYAWTTDSTSSNAALSSNTATHTTTATNNGATATNQSTTATNQSTGESGVGKNMPPYIMVNVWQRTA